MTLKQIHTKWKNNEQVYYKNIPYHISGYAIQETQNGITKTVYLRDRVNPNCQYAVLLDNITEREMHNE